MSDPSSQSGNEMTLHIRTANRDRKAEIAVDPNIRVSEILEAAMQNWALSGDYDYVIRADRLGTQLRPSATLVGSGIQDGDILEIQPIADAGVTAVDRVKRPYVFRWLDGYDEEVRRWA